MPDLARANLLISCDTCRADVEVMLGVPVTDAAASAPSTYTSALADHLRASQRCRGGMLTVQGGVANAEAYAAIKPLLPGVPRLMLYPRGA